MSLQVWLPLNGNLDNKGIADISITNNGATINNGGKIGQCYYFDNTYAYSNLDYSDFGTDFTVAFWYKIDTAFGGNRHLICLANNWGWENLVFTCAATATNQFSFNIGNGNTSSRIITCPYVVGEWQHICFTFKNKNAKIYVNGVFLKSGTYPINPDWTKTQKIGLGGTPAGEEKSSTLYLNDVRVYNHCLSKKEIKEISKGLVLHYNFEIVPISNEKYNATYVVYNNYSSKVIITLQDTGKTYEGSPIYRETIKVIDSSMLNSVRTSLYAHGINWNNTLFNVNEPLVAGILWRPVTHSDTQVGGTASNRFTPKWTKTQQYKDGWTRFNVCRVNETSESGSDGFYISVCCPSLQLNEELILEFCQPELYRGIDYAPIRNAYTQNIENIIYDSSGYGNDAQVVGKIQYSTDSKVGNYSLYFDGTSDNTRGYLTVLNKKAKLPITTVSLWAYSPDWQSTRKEKMISCTESGGWQLSHNDNAGKIGCPLYVNNGYRHLFAQNTEASAGWHMFTFTWDGYDGYFYLDGERKGTTYHSDNYAEITYNANNNILVGAEPRWRKYCIR